MSEISLQDFIDKYSDIENETSYENLHFLTGVLRNIRWQSKQKIFYDLHDDTKDISIEIIALSENLVFDLSDFVSMHSVLQKNDGKLKMVS